MQLKRQTYVPTTEEHDRIEQALLNYPYSQLFINKRNWTIFKIGSLTGMRINEILNLQLAWINLETRKIWIPAEINKTSTESFVYINNELLQILQAYLETHKSYFWNGYLFNNIKTRLPMTGTGYLWHWHRALEHAGLGEVKFIAENGSKQRKIRFHNATRSYFINKVFQTHPERNLADLARVFRHADVRTTFKHYLRFDDLKLWQELTKDI